MASLSNIVDKIKTRRAERRRRKVEVIETNGRHGGDRRLPTSPGRRIVGGHGSSF